MTAYNLFKFGCHLGFAALVSVAVVLILLLLADDPHTIEQERIFILTVVYSLYFTAVSLPLFWGTKQ